MRVHGKTQVLSIYTPMARTIAENAAIGSHNTDDNVNQKYEKDELALWQLALQAYRLQQWDISNQYLKELIVINPSNMMYAFYIRRIALLRLQSLDSSWDVFYLIIFIEIFNCPDIFFIRGVFIVDYENF